MKSRVLFLEHCTDGTIGGSHLCLLEICRHINRNLYDPVVCFFESNALIHDFESAGAEVMVLHFPATWSSPAWLPSPITRVFGFALNLIRTLVIRTALWVELLRKNNIDLVHINNACGYDHDLMLACRLLGKPCVVHQRGIQEVIDVRTRYFANRVDRIIAISDVVANNLRNQGIDEKQIIRIDDGIDESRFAQIESEESVRKRFRLSSEMPVIGIVGNIKYWKGQHVVVEALALLVRQFPTIRCLFVGSKVDEPYYQQLMKKARSFGIPDDQLLFSGYEPHPADLMRVMDVVVHASVEPEPFGIVLLEAMGAGRPLVATNIGGPTEIIVPGKTGLLVPPGDVLALTRAITQLLSNQNDVRCMGEQGRARFFDRYTVQNSLAKLERLYREIIGNH